MPVTNYTERHTDTAGSAAVAAGKSDRRETMNVYDFDKTLFWGDSEERFFDYLAKQKGYFWHIVRFHVLEFLANHKIVLKTRIREQQYKVLKKIHKIDDLDRLLNAYWDEVEQYLMPWYESVKQPDDIIASGTPRFIMEPILKRMGLTNLVATEMDTATGKIEGRFAVADAKLENFLKQYSPDDIDNFYSDAYSDHFLADIAKHAYIVDEKGGLTDWNAYFEAHPEKKKIPYRV